MFELIFNEENFFPLLRCIASPLQFIILPDAYQILSLSCSHNIVPQAAAALSLFDKASTKFSKKDLVNNRIN